jgi:predicted AAA+ superfamily ATPase
MIKRQMYLDQIGRALSRSRVVVLTGPRQCGKTTLARQFCPSTSPNYFDLEDPSHLAVLDEPLSALRSLKGVVVIDEIQRRPELFPVLRVLADRTPLPARFLILGSASPALLRQSSESLAGRLEMIEVAGFSVSELGPARSDALWLRGGFPLAFLAATDEDSLVWRRNFIQTFLERDLPQFGIGIAPVALRRFWAMLAHYHGQIWHGAELARSLAVSESSVRKYLDTLEQVCMVRVLQPWFENLNKRQVKSPKIIFRDSGILHTLLGCATERELLEHPKSGASWEGYALETLLRLRRPDEAYFWATQNRAELDLLLIHKGHRHGYEFKRADAPKLTPSMKIARTDLKLDSLTVVYPGDRSYTLSDGTRVRPLVEAASADSK